MGQLVPCKKKITLYTIGQNYPTKVTLCGKKESDGIYGEKKTTVRVP
ncbi:MAG: hypothetical protein ACI9K9_001470 [Neolewinella sp.]|jgi:hypothetical protein